MRVLWNARRSNQSILKEISPEYSLDGLMLKLKLRHFGHLMRRTDSLEKTEKGTAENEMVGWHHRLNGCKFEQSLGDREAQGSLACCTPWGEKELDTTLVAEQQQPVQGLGAFATEAVVSMPCRGTKIPEAVWCNQKLRQEISFD